MFLNIISAFKHTSSALRVHVFTVARSGHSDSVCFFFFSLMRCLPLGHIFLPIITTRFVIGGAVAHVVERAVRPQRGPVLHAASRGPSVGSGGPARVAHVSGARGGLHGPHPRLPRAGGETEGPAGRHG